MLSEWFTTRKKHFPFFILSLTRSFFLCRFAVLHHTRIFFVDVHALVYICEWCIIFDLEDYIMYFFLKWKNFYTSPFRSVYNILCIHTLNRRSRRDNITQTAYINCRIKYYMGGNKCVQDDSSTMFTPIFLLLIISSFKFWLMTLFLRVNY